jgi:hypothetical protein
MGKSTDHDEDEGEFIDAEEYLQHALMNETKAYFDRGRRFEKLDVTQLNEKWVVVFKVYLADHTRQQGLEMDDLAAELRLRGLDPPFEAVKAEISKLQGALKRIGPHASSPEFEQKVSEFLRAAKQAKTLRSVGRARRRCGNLSCVCRKLDSAILNGGGRQGPA